MAQLTAKKAAQMGRMAAHTGMTRAQLVGMLLCQDVTATSALGRIAEDHFNRTVAIVQVPGAETPEAVIARTALRLGFESTEVRGRDSLDFHDVGIAGLVVALQDVFEAGRRSAAE